MCFFDKRTCSVLKFPLSWCISDASGYVKENIDSWPHDVESTESTDICTGRIRLEGWSKGKVFRIAKDKESKLAMIRPQELSLEML